MNARAIPRSILRRHAPPSGARLAMLVAALALAAAALGRPMLPLPSDVFRHLVVFDITQSMNVGDAVPGDDTLTRLEHAKAVVLEAATALPCGSELGLGLFTGHRTFLLVAPVEICTSYPDLAATVRAVDWRMAWTARSEIAKGVHSALGIAEALGPQTVLVFLTDGHEAPPLHPELRPDFGREPGAVRGLLAGVGGPAPLPIPKLDPQGKNLGFWGADDVMQVDELSLGRGTSVSEGYAGTDAGSVQDRIDAGTEHLSASAGAVSPLARGWIAASLSAGGERRRPANCAPASGLRERTHIDDRPAAAAGGGRGAVGGGKLLRAGKETAPTPRALSGRADTQRDSRCSRTSAFELGEMGRKNPGTRVTDVGWTSFVGTIHAAWIPAFAGTTIPASAASFP